jgi:L-ribulose-5-phosphate 3-epimerase UlaE
VHAAEDECHKTMTLQEAKSIARHLGLTLRQVRSGAYRVNFRDGSETTAYYTDSLEDAVKTAAEMARNRGVAQAIDETVATERVPGTIADMPLNPKATRPQGEE